MRLALIPCAPTEWHTEGRLLGRTELEATPAGQARCIEWAESLRNTGLAAVYHGPDELSQLTARLVARQLALAVRSAKALAELDIGLWAGLTDAQLRSRFASAHRELCEAPLNVTPPGGETVGDALARLRSFLQKQRGRNGQQTLGLVTRPLLWALARCTLAGDDLAEVWPAAQAAQEPVLVEFR